MKVVINSCFGGFNLSDEAIEKCIEYGMSCTECDNKAKFFDSEAFFCKLTEDLKVFGKYGTNRKFDRVLRCNPTVVRVVEELGVEKASGRFAALKIIEIPFESCEGWQIDDYDGVESVIPTVTQRWS